MIQEYRTEISKTNPEITYTINKIFVHPGQSVSIDQDLLEVMTTKITTVIPSQHEGIVEEIFVKPDQEDIPQGFLLLTLREQAMGDIGKPMAQPENMALATSRDTAEKTPAEKPASAPETRPPSAPVQRSPLPVSPLAQALAEAWGIDIDSLDIPPDTLRVTKKFLEAVKQRWPMQQEAIVPVSLPDFSRFGKIEEKPLDAAGKALAGHLAQVWTTVPHAWMMEKADITDLDRHRLEAKAQITNLSWTAIYIKAVVGALKQFPNCNASFDITGKRIILKKHYHIGVAVDTPKGLFVPAVMDADRKSLSEIAGELVDFSTRSKDGKGFSREELESHSFTISNVGMFGSTGILPIVHAPDSAILGLTAARKELLWDEKTQQPAPRLLLPMTLGFDHRVVNGAEASQFLAVLKRLLEGPVLNVF
jgi:pyruvate dehydrogenase E2 component (dihydrolipoamide acetyltransferase)